MALVNNQYILNAVLDLGPRALTVANDPVVQRDARQATSDIRKAAASVAQFGRTIGGAWGQTYPVSSPLARAS